MTTAVRTFALALVASLFGPVFSACATQVPNVAANVAPTETPQTVEAAPKPRPVEHVERQDLAPFARVGNILLAGQPSRQALAHLATEGTRVVVDLRRAEEDRGFDEPLAAKGLGLEYVRHGFGGPVPLSDEIFASVRGRLAAHRAGGDGDLLLHCSSSNRVGAVWLTSRVLDEHVEWKTALDEAHAVGLASKAMEDAARTYVMGGGNQELGQMVEKLRTDFPEVARIDVDDLATRLKGDRPPLLLDVREPEEFAISQLLGARNVHTLDEALAAVGADREREVVVYCSVGYRSAKFAEKLDDHGVKNVRNLEGSIFAWANSGHPVYRGTQRASRVHPYDVTWGRMLTPGLRADLDK